MLQWIKNIFLTFFSAIFLYAVCGLYFINHHCNKTGNTDIHFKPIVKCECNMQDHVSCSSNINQEEHSCHELPQQKELKKHPAYSAKDDCCIFNIFFIKIFSPLFKTPISHFKSILHFFSVWGQLDFKHILSRFYSSFEAKHFEPPPEQNTSVFLKNKIIRV